MIKEYTILFNNCLNNKFYPDDWKKAKVLPVLKKGKPDSESSSYRPISLTPAISKVYEAVINRTLKTYSERNEILTENQYGFRYKLSTTHALHKVINDINAHLHNDLVVGACLVDLEKAFDSVWIFGLLYILLILKFPIDFIQLIWHMTINRKFVTYNGEKISSLFFDIIEGLMQGTVNTPELFNIFTYNIPILFGLNDNNTHSVAFADDFIILVADKFPSIVQAKLEDLVNKVNQHYSLWNLRINPSKCETILFHKPLRFLTSSIRTQIKAFTINIFHNNSKYPIEHKKVVKYLGVQLDYLFRLNIHVNAQLNKAKKSFRAHSRLFFNKTLPARAKVICYLLLIRPILTYAAPIWWNLSASIVEKLKKFERSCLRASLHWYRKSDTKYFISNKHLYNRANVPRIDSFMIKLTRDYYANIKKINNHYLQQYCVYSEPDCVDRSRTGYLLPQSFMFFDSLGYVTSANNTPLLYHTPRHSANKKIDISIPPSNIYLKYSTVLPNRDITDKYLLNKKYW